MDGDKDFNRCWEQQRRRPGGRFDVRIWGFGRGARDDQFALWVPNPTAPGITPIFTARKIAASIPASRDAAIEILRQLVCDGLQHRRDDLPAWSRTGLILYQYAAAVLNATYRSPGMNDLSAEDLAYALGGDDWMDGMIEHALRPDGIVVDLDACATETKNR